MSPYTSPKDLRLFCFLAQHCEYSAEYFHRKLVEGILRSKAFYLRNDQYCYRKVVYTLLHVLVFRTCSDYIFIQQYWMDSVRGLIIIRLFPLFYIETMVKYKVLLNYLIFFLLQFYILNSIFRNHLSSFFLFYTL